MVLLRNEIKIGRHFHKYLVKYSTFEAQLINSKNRKLTDNHVYITEYKINYLIMNSYYHIHLNQQTVK